MKLIDKIRKNIQKYFLYSIFDFEIFHVWYLCIFVIVPLFYHCGNPLSCLVSFEKMEVMLNNFIVPLVCLKTFFT